MGVNTISFPGLGIGEFTVDRVAFSLFGKNIYWYGVIIGIGFALGVLFAIFRVKKEGFTSDTILDLGIFGLPVSIIFARLFYVIGDLDSVNTFWDAFKIWNGGLSIIGGMIGMTITGIVYSKIKKLSFLKLFDFILPSVMIGQIIGRWGNFINCEVFGRETESLFRMVIGNGPGVHPLFLYESLWMLVGFIIYIIASKRKTADGQMVSFYLVWYGIARFFMESMRAEEYILRSGGLPISKIMAGVMVLMGILLFVFVTVNRKHTGGRKMKEITQKRKELDKAIESGADADTILKISRELDELVDEYMDSQEMREKEEAESNK